MAYILSRNMLNATSRVYVEYFEDMEESCIEPDHQGRFLINVVNVDSVQRGILRRRMIEGFLHSKPTNRAHFNRISQISLRLKMNERQATEYLDMVLGIMAMIKPDT
jgi:hypothetical protein